MVIIASAYLLGSVVKLVRVRSRRRNSKLAGNSVSALESDSHVSHFVKSSIESMQPAGEPWVPISTVYKDRTLIRSDPYPASPVSGGKATENLNGATSEFEARLSEHLLLADCKREIESLRRDVETLKSEFKVFRTSRNVAPQYSEALELVQRGFTTQDIADRLEISIAEAELVYALGCDKNTYKESTLNGTESEDSSFAFPRSEKY